MSERKPSEVDRLNQKSAPPTRESGMGSADPGAIPGVSHSPSDVSRESQGRNAPVKSPDGLGSMSKGMGGTRSSRTTPAAPPSHRP